MLEERSILATCGLKNLVLSNANGQATRSHSVQNSLALRGIGPPAGTGWGTPNNPIVWDAAPPNTLLDAGQRSVERHQCGLHADAVRSPNASDNASERGKVDESLFT